MTQKLSGSHSVQKPAYASIMPLYAALLPPRDASITCSISSTVECLGLAKLLTVEYVFEAFRAEFQGM